VFTAKASDRDAGPYGVVRYQLTPTSEADVGAFVIDEVTGDVTSGRVFNSSATYRSFQYRVTATDAGRLNSTVGAIIKVHDVRLMSCWLGVEGVLAPLLVKVKL